ncbi:MAG: sigma-70 family RNA polymerase sigma factor [Propionibacteriales bacterium]|nr:sigma-70 family RNA polymerase sigma factor [Propionibacteriales bacterium]
MTRFQPLINHVLRRFPMSSSDREDVSQTVWLRLISSLESIRTPAAIPAWIATTARNEALRALANRGRQTYLDSDSLSAADEPSPDLGVEEYLERRDRRAAFREGLAELDPYQRQLLQLLIVDPPASYKAISQQLGIPVGSIGPTRARCLERLRRTAALKHHLIENSVPIAENSIYRNSTVSSR